MLRSADQDCQGDCKSCAHVCMQERPLSCLSNWTNVQKHIYVWRIEEFVCYGPAMKDRTLAWFVSSLLCAALTITGSPASPQQTTAPQGPQSPPPQRGGQGWASQQKSQAWATEKLAKSPRRSEWVTIPNGSRTLRAFVTYPEVKGKVQFVIVLHEVFGLPDSTRNTADEIAAMGYITHRARYTLRTWAEWRQCGLL